MIKGLEHAKEIEDLALIMQMLNQEEILEEEEHPHKT